MSLAIDCEIWKQFTIYTVPYMEFVKKEVIFFGRKNSTMKCIRFLPLIVLLFITTLTHGQIDFRDGSWSEIIEMAKTENKPIFVDAYAVWCGPCKMMDRQVFPQQEVGDFFNENFINAKIDMEKGEGRDLQKQYKVTAFPTLLFINKEGELIHRAVGFQNPEKLINSGKIALRKNHNVADFEKRYEEGERDPDFVLELLKEMKKAEKSTEKITLEYLQDQTDLSDAKKANIAFEGMENIDSKLFTVALEGKKHLKEGRTEQEFNRTLKSAAQNTMQTAIQFDAPEIFDQSIRDLIKIELSPHVITQIEREYYAKTKNESDFLKSVEEELKTSNPDHGKLAMEIYQAFPESNDMLEVARDLFNKSFPSNQTMDNLVLGLSIAIGMKDSLYLDEVYEVMKMKYDLTQQEKKQVDDLHQRASRFLEEKIKREN